MPLQRRDTDNTEGRSYLTAADLDGDASSIRSDQESDSDDDERLSRARNSRELRAHDRLVLMEEDEMDQLVIESRRRQERERRGSNMSIPNPLRLFRQYSDHSPAPSRTPSFPAGASSETLVSERKTQRAERRARRKAKKDRLIADAQHGEDGVLMYEMEEGGMKDGSSTGDSSDREDSEEMDRKGLLQLADKAKRGRTWRRWLFIHTMIVVAFSIIVLVAWKLTMEKRKEVKSETYKSNGTALFAPTTIIISLDGFRADFLNRGLTPRLNAFIKEGISPLYMHPSFPSVTFPNHYTLATGLYPEAHGVVGNTFWDPEMQAEFYYTDPARSLDPKWWKGEPFWVSAEKQGIRSAIHMWPGSEAHIMEIEPSFLDKFKGDEKLDKKVHRIFEFLDKPGREDPNVMVDEMRPQLIAAYVPNVDSDGHKYGPNSTEIRTTIQDADTMLDQIFTGLEERNLTQIVNVIVVSDHGMATTDVSRLIQLEDLVDLSKIEHIDGWPLYGLRPKNPEDLQGIYDQLVEKMKTYPSIEVYLRDVNMPERYHFSKNDRIAPLWIVPKTGWAIVKKEEFNVEAAKSTGAVYHPRGLHGYDHEHPLMRAIFIARGPAFPHQPGSRVEVFQNIEVYNILCDSVGITPMPNNGTLRLPLRPTGLHDSPDTGLETPQDPVETTHSALPQDSSSSAAAPTKAVGVDPVASSNPSNSIGVDRPPADAQPTSQPSGPAGGEDGGEDGKDGEDDGGKPKNPVYDLWDWIAGKIDDLWNKLSGSGSKGDGESGSQ